VLLHFGTKSLQTQTNPAPLQLRNTLCFRMLLSGELRLAGRRMDCRRSIRDTTLISHST